MTMNDTSIDLDPTDQLAALAAGMNAEIERGKAASIVQPRYSTGESSTKSKAYEGWAGGGRAPGGVVEARPQIFSGPPHSRQTLGPLALLSEVAEHTKQLRDQVRELARAVTGHAPPDRLPAMPSRPSGTPVGLLPNIAQLATEIDVAQTDIAGLIEQLRRQL